MPVITIRGKLGSGAPEIGKMLSQKLSWDYIDREIIAQVASRLNLQETEVIAKEMPPVSLRERIEEALQKGYATGVGVQGAYLPISQIPLDDTRYLAALTTLVKELAQGRSIIYGRGSQFVLREHPHTINVSIVAPIKTRLKRVMETMNLNEDKAKHEMTRFDNAAREFLKRYFGAEMEDPTCYDIVVNTERIDYEMACSVIIHTLRLKEPPPPKPSH
ncbi:MAG TPA: cytidylate kinase-like family protein [Dehalococcoidales bacterium]|nr:cytidylate kinase-like family protein [Dehalococcoidales bacterium]